MNVFLSYQPKLKADVVAIIHFLWLMLMIAGLPIMLVWEPYKYAAVSLMIITVVSWVVWGDCPLYIFEMRLRNKVDVGGMYRGSFMSHYLHKFFGLDIPTQTFTVLGYVYAGLIIVLALLL